MRAISSSWLFPIKYILSVRCISVVELFLPVAEAQ